MLLKVLQEYPLGTTCAIGGAAAYLLYVWKRNQCKDHTGQIPISVNVHFTRECNYACRFCFHREATSDKENLDKMKLGLKLLKEAGTRKVNFAGGEPFLYPRELGEMMKYCKEELKLESVSVVTNGSKVSENFFKKYGQYLDIMAVSCDSFNDKTNFAIGRAVRGHKAADQFKTLKKCAELCRQCDVKFKINTVVLKLNYNEDMAQRIRELDPFRWKCFQVLMVKGENDFIEHDTEHRNVRELLISDEEFKIFCAKHEHLECFVPEPNNVMAGSYLILDEYWRFLDKDGQETPSQSIFDVGVQKALSQVRWDEQAFRERGGEYNWSRQRAGGEHEHVRKELEW